VQIREIKVRELPDFIKSEDYKNLDIKPITELRAVSQYFNPDADPEDLALIYASNDNELLGFAGLLPKKANSENIQIYSNSCWWANQQKGKGIAVPLFLQLLKRADTKLFLSESTPRAKSIIEKTGLFGEIKSNKGIRGFIRFYLADIIQNKYPGKKWMQIPFMVLDFLLNFVLVPFKNYHLSRFKKNSFSIEKVNEVDKEIETFINKYSLSELVQKNAAHFSWFKKYGWLKFKDKNSTIRYPFTHEAKSFELNYYAFREKGELKAFVAISNRDNLAKVPYVYFDKKNIQKVVNTIMALLLQNKYDSLAIFHKEIVEFMGKHKMPFYFRKTETKYSGTTKKIEHIFKQKPILQDGDGDVIFI